MRIQTIELPSQTVDDGYVTPYLLVFSEVEAYEAQAIAEIDMKSSLDHCAGVITSFGPVQVGPESAYEVKLRLTGEQVVEDDEPVTGINEQDALEKLVEAGIFPERMIDCPERERGRGCACLVGAEDCPSENGVIVIPVDDKTPDEIAADAQALAEQKSDAAADAALSES